MLLDLTSALQAVKYAKQLGINLSPFLLVSLSVWGGGARCAAGRHSPFGLTSHSLMCGSAHRCVCIFTPAQNFHILPTATRVADMKDGAPAAARCACCA